MDNEFEDGDDDLFQSPTTVKPHPRRDINTHIECHLLQNYDHETGLTDDQVLQFYRRDLKQSDVARVKSHTSEFCHQDPETGEWRWYKPMHPLHASWSAQANHEFSERYGLPLAPKWQAILDRGEVQANTYNPRPGRKVLLAEPTLTQDDHHALAELLHGFWDYLYTCRQQYKSDEKQYKAIKGVTDSLKVLVAIMSEEINELFDQPEDAKSLYHAVEPKAPKRIKNTLFPQKGLRLDIDTHHTLYNKLIEVGRALVGYKKRYPITSWGYCVLQPRYMVEVQDALGVLFRAMRDEIRAN